MPKDKKIPKTKQKKDELSELKQKCEEYLAGWKRAQADYQNLQKQTAEEKAELIKYANGNLITSLLPILDNFNVALTQAEKDKDNPWVKGFEYIKKQLQDFFTDLGVKEINPHGEMFNPEFHEAVESASLSDKKDGEIIECKRSGYLLGDKVLQAAKVVVNNLENKA